MTQIKIIMKGQMAHDNNISIMETLKFTMKWIFKKNLKVKQSLF